MRTVIQVVSYNQYCQGGVEGTAYAISLNFDKTLAAVVKHRPALLVEVPVCQHLHQAGHR